MADSDKDEELEGLLNSLIDEEPTEEPKEAPAESTDNALPQATTQTITAGKSKKEVSLNIADLAVAHEKDYSTVMNNITIDRCKIDSVVSLLMEKMTDNSAKTGEVESLVRALSAMADTNNSIVRLMGERSKFIIALKNYIPRGGDGDTATNDTLADLLSQPEDSV